MPPFLYRCPNTGMTCLACAQTHLVNSKTGKVLGSDDE